LRVVRGSIKAGRGVHANSRGIAKAMPFNGAKAPEYEPADPTNAPADPHEEMPSLSSGASTALPPFVHGTPARAVLADEFSSQ
jgi:hypothetical protein